MNLKDGLLCLIKKNEWIYFVQREMRLSFDPKYRKRILSLGTYKDDSFRITRRGSLNKGKVLYVYNENHAVGMGFFAVYRYMIEACCLCDWYGFVPVFHFGRDFPYSESGKIINGEKDSYKMFFQNPSEIDYSEAGKSFAVIISDGEKIGYIRRLLLGDEEAERVEYEYNDNYFKEMSKYSKKYIKLNPMLEREMNTDIERLIGKKKTLAVHVRIKVFQHGINNHPKVASLDDYIRKAEEALDQGQFSQIFLATEEKDTIDAFKNRFGDKVIYYQDVFRTEEGNITYLNNERNNHRYRLGYEVLRDMHTMAWCDGLIAGLSQVSFCAQITKYERNEEYQYRHIFNLGVNKSNYTAKDDYRQLKKKEAR